MKTRFPSAVLTLPLHASRCPHRTLRASSFASRRQLRSSPQHPAAGFHQTLYFFIKITSKQWCKALAGSREDAPFVGSTTTPRRSASPSLHQPGSEMGRAKIGSWHRPKTKLRMARHLLFWLKMVLPSLSSLRRILAAFHTSQPQREQHKALEGSCLRYERVGMLGTCG